MATLAFDMFGTLVDPASQAEQLRGHVEEPEAVAAAWRRHQVEISWLLSLTGRYEDWGAVTRYGLEAALAELDVALAPVRLEEVLASAQPALFPDVRQALAALQEAGQHRLAVFSNGAPDQLRAILERTLLADVFSDVVSVHDVGIYKPSPAVYQHAAGTLGLPIDAVWLVSGNPFDAAGAKLAGMRVAKLERGPSWRYAFAPPPDLVIGALDELAPALAREETSRASR